ncbi:unnamed protein product [Sphagnum compactum]
MHMKEPQIPRTDVSRKIEVNIAQLQTCIKKLMQHDENLAIPESPEVSLNCSKVSKGDAKEVLEEASSEFHYRSLLFGFVSGLLLASGSQGLLPQKWHANPLASSWQKSSIRKPVLEMSKSVEDLENCGSTSSSHPVGDLISIHKGYGHVRTLVQRIQYDHFRGFANAYVGDYPSLSLSPTTGDHPNVYQTKSLGGPWNHLTGILGHIRT